MEHLVGLSKELALQELEKKGMSFEIVCNNHNVQGDTMLVTNAKLSENNTVILTIGSFIFDLKD